MSAVRTAAVAVLLAGPAVAAFFTGGYTPAGRAWTGLVAWALVAVAVLTAPRARAPRAPGERPAPLLPAGRPARLALGGLAGLALLTLLSTAWAPVAQDAWSAGRLAAAYAGALLAAALLLRDRTRAVEPALALGTLAVVGYALSERLLPGLIELDRSLSAKGRLEQPLTYWNALGALAALGVVLCARLAGDASRPSAMRAAAAAAAAPLGAGLYLTVSRGALFACGAGLLALLVAAGRREQLRGAAVAAGAAALAAAAVAPFGGVTSYAGSAAARERDGAIALVLLLVVMALAAAVERVTAAEERPGPLLLPRWAPAAALAVVVAGFALAVALGGDERSSGTLAPGAQRYATLTSNRYAYWKVAARAFEAQPARGVGAGGWAVWWWRDRPFREGARDAHSLYVQTAAELGLAGLALLAAWLAGIALAAREALRRHGDAAAGLVAGVVVWAAHVALDWDFQMPAATLPAIVLMGALLTLAARPAAPAPAPAAAGSGD